MYFLGIDLKWLYHVSSSWLMIKNCSESRSRLYAMRICVEQDDTGLCSCLFCLKHVMSGRSTDPISHQKEINNVL